MPFRNLFCVFPIGNVSFAQSRNPIAVAFFDVILKSVLSRCDINIGLTKFYLITKLNSRVITGVLGMFEFFKMAGTILNCPVAFIIALLDLQHPIKADDLCARDEKIIWRITHIPGKGAK